ncbi:MAG: hypothetical protein ACI9QN_002748, partial [Arcticibacterium sp.]
MGHNSTATNKKLLCNLLVGIFLRDEFQDFSFSSREQFTLTRFMEAFYQ